MMSSAGDDTTAVPSPTALSTGSDEHSHPSPDRLFRPSDAGDPQHTMSEPPAVESPQEAMQELYPSALPRIMTNNPRMKRFSEENRDVLNTDKATRSWPRPPP